MDNQCIYITAPKPAQVMGVSNGHAHSLFSTAKARDFLGTFLFRITSFETIRHVIIYIKTDIHAEIIKIIYTRPFGKVILF